MGLREHNVVSGGLLLVSQLGASITCCVDYWWWSLVNLCLCRHVSWVTLPLTCEKALGARKELWNQIGNMPSGRDNLDVAPTRHLSILMMLLSLWHPGQAGHRRWAHWTTEQERCHSVRWALALSLWNDNEMVNCMSLSVYGVWQDCWELKGIKPDNSWYSSP